MFIGISTVEFRLVTARGYDLGSSTLLGFPSVRPLYESRHVGSNLRRHPPNVSPTRNRKGPVMEGLLREVWVECLQVHIFNNYSWSCFQGLLTLLGFLSDAQA